MNSKVVNNKEYCNAYNTGILHLKQSMKYLIFVLILIKKRHDILVIILVLASCNNAPVPQGKSSKSEQLVTDEKIKPQSSAKEKIPKDTFKRIDPDIYCIDENDVIKTGKQRNYNIVSNRLTSFDNAWFTNDSLDQSIVMGLYTDGFRTHYIHFYNHSLPDNEIRHLIFHSSNESQALPSLKKQKSSLTGFIKAAKRIPPRYFTSKNGIELGCQKSALIALYGEPDSVKYYQNMEVYNWVFAGDIDLQNMPVTKNKPLAAFSYGYLVIAYFKNNQLVCQVLENEVP